MQNPIHRNSRSFIGLLLATGATALTVAAACSEEEQVSCGPGTLKTGLTCIVAPTLSGTDPDSGVTSDSGGNPGEAVGPSFDGATAAATASATSLMVTWGPASDEDTQGSRILYNVYSSLAAGGQNFGDPMVTPPGASSLVVQNLEPGVEVFFVVRAVNSAGEEDANSVEVSAIPVADIVPPEFAGLETAVGDGATSVRLTWTAATDDQTPGDAIRYLISFSETETLAASSDISAVTPPGVTELSFDLLPLAETDYFFAVRAVDASNNADSNAIEVPATTLPDTTPPVFGGCENATDPGASNVFVTWQPAADDVTPADEITYNVYASDVPLFIDENGDGGSLDLGEPVGSFVGGTSATVQGILPATHYYLVCRAADAVGNEDSNLSAREFTTVDDGAAPVFSGITGMELSSTFADLGWDAATDDRTASQNIRYRIYVSETSAGHDFESPPTMESAPGETSVTLTGIESDTSQYFVVHAVDQAGNEDDNTTELGGVTDVSFEQDVQSIFTQRCTLVGCHSGADPVLGQNLSRGFAYFSIVDVVAAQSVVTEIDPNFPVGSFYKRIDSSSSTPEDSLLYRKISLDIPPVGLRMPRGQTPLLQEDIDLIGRWISQGAQNN